MQTSSIEADIRNIEAPRQARLGDMVRAHPLTAFFALAYGVSWALLAILHGLFALPSGLVIILQTAGPTVAAVIVARAADGRAGPRGLLARTRIWRVGIRWYLFAIVGLPIACVAAALLMQGGVDSFADASLPGVPMTFFVYLVVGWISGPLLEEPGWRGFALPRMEAESGPLVGALALGVLWAAWHLPQFLVPEWAAENGGSDAMTIVVFVAMVVALSVMMTWVFNHTRGSIFIAMLVHSSVNASLAMLPLAPARVLGVGLLAFGVISVALIVATRGRLGFRERSTPLTIRGKAR